MIKEILPSSLKVDKKAESIVEAADKVIKELLPLIEKVLIVPNIDNAPSNILDLLAWQFHLEGYELAQTDEQKRNMIKKAIELHRYKGTKWAIKGVLEALGLSGEIKEWFEYDGEPFKFKIYLNSALKSDNDYKKMLSLVKEYKNERSWLDSIGLLRSYNSDISISFAAKSGNDYSIGLRCDANIEKGFMKAGCVKRTSNTTVIGVSEINLNLPATNLYSTSAFRQAKTWQIGVRYG